MCANAKRYERSIGVLKIAQWVKAKLANVIRLFFAFQINNLKTNDLDILSVMKKTLTGASVFAEDVTVGTPAGVASGRVVANADAEVVVLELLALVDVLAGAVVGSQGVPVLTGAPIASPGVVAVVLALVRVDLTLVEIPTDSGLGVVLEAALAHAFVRTRGVEALAASRWTAQATRQHPSALVDVHAFVVTANLVAFEHF